MNRMTRFCFPVVILVALSLFAGCTGDLQTQINTLNSQLSDLNSQLSEQKNLNTQLRDKNAALEAHAKLADELQRKLVELKTLEKQNGIDYEP